MLKLSMIFAAGFIASIPLLAGPAGAQSSDIVADIATIRANNLGTFTQLAVEGYYGNGTPGGGLFYLQSGSCGTTASGALTSSSNQFVNYSGQLYFGEPVSNANLPSGTTVSSTRFTAVTSSGKLHGSTTIDQIPDVSNITLGMTVASPDVLVNTTVTAKSAPVTSFTKTGSFNNGKILTIVGGTSGITAGMFVVMTADGDTPPSTTPRSAIKPGTTVMSTTPTTVTLTDTISGQAASATLFFSSGGSVTISNTATGSPMNNPQMIFYGRTATLSQNATATTAATLTANGDDGGMHIIDSGGNCFARNTTTPDVMGWGAKCDDSTDDTGALQNAEIFAEAPNSAIVGSARSVRFPPSGSGACVATNLQIIRPVPWLGDGRQQADILQKSGATGPLVYTFALYDPTSIYNAYNRPEMAFEDIHLTGNSADTNVGMELDGYDGGNNTPGGMHLYMRNLTIDQFGGNLMLVDRDDGVIGRGFNVQLKGIGAASNAQDCLHVDGPQNVWHFYDFIQSGCNNGQYLANTGSWAEFSTVAFDNNHAVFVTGTQYPANAPIILTDEEFSNNFENGIVVDTQNARVICSLCRVQDTGTKTTQNTYSDIEITANAAGNNSPVLTVIGGLFTDVFANVGTNHKHNIVYDSGSIAEVVVDGTTTTTAVGQKIDTNLTGCSCAGTMVADQNLVTTTSLLDPVLPDARLAIGANYGSLNSCLNRDGTSSIDLEACDASNFNVLNLASMRVRDGTPSSSNYVQVQAPNSPTNYNFILPAAVGTAGTLLASQAGSSAETWVDVSRQVSSFNHTTGATMTVPGRLVLSIAYQLFDFERNGATSAFSDTWDTAANILAGYGAGNVTVGVPLRGVICNNTGFAETLLAGTGVTLAGTTMVAANSCLHVSLIFTNTSTPAVTITGA